MPPWVGSGCRQISVATGSPSSGRASSATSLNPSAVSRVTGSRRAGSTELARIFWLTGAGYRASEVEHVLEVAEGVADAVADRVDAVADPVPQPVSQPV